MTGSTARPTRDGRDRPSFTASLRGRSAGPASVTSWAPGRRPDVGDRGGVGGAPVRRRGGAGGRLRRRGRGGLALALGGGRRRLPWRPRRSASLPQADGPPVVEDDQDHAQDDPDDGDDHRDPGEDVARLGAEGARAARRRRRRRPGRPPCRAGSGPGRSGRARSGSISEFEDARSECATAGVLRIESVRCREDEDAIGDRRRSRRLGRLRTSVLAAGGHRLRRPG